MDLRIQLSVRVSSHAESLNIFIKDRYFKIYLDLVWPFRAKYRVHLQ
jgi:hypothetical protein